MPARAHSDAELDAAVAQLADPARLQAAQDRVAAIAPQLQRVLNEALAAGGWFGAAHEEQLARAAGYVEPQERVRAVRTFVAEETRLAMLVGVAVGFELSRTLRDGGEEPNS